MPSTPSSPIPNAAPLSELVAVDVGNTRIKLGRFAPGSAELGPASTLRLELASTMGPALRQWLANSPGRRTWVIGKVHRQGAEQLARAVRELFPEDSVLELSHDDLPIAIALAEPKRVGIDRLLAAIAANRLRAPDRGAIVIDAGTAMTVDCVSRDGAFLGGAILPGLNLSARALHEYTDQLPLETISELDAPPAPLGRSTREAIRSGLFWGAVGAARELAARMTPELGPQPNLLLTGGAGLLMATPLGAEVTYHPDLVLQGIVIVAEQLTSAA